MSYEEPKYLVEFTKGGFIGTQQVMTLAEIKRWKGKIRVVKQINKQVDVLKK